MTLGEVALVIVGVVLILALTKFVVFAGSAFVEGLRKGLRAEKDHPDSGRP